ncbi:kinase-like domain-containing protein [Melampsora americana]|nr:kinase-like domain-containing protein [Melampsora americana]
MDSNEIVEIPEQSREIKITNEETIKERTKPIRPTIASIQTEHLTSPTPSLKHLTTPQSEQHDQSNIHSSSTISRASSARSTSSVKAVPIKTPSRRPSQTPSHQPTMIFPTTNSISYQLPSSSTSTTASIQTQKPARKTIKDYHIGEILGEGSYSTVYQAIDKTKIDSEPFAIKVLDKRHIQKEKKTKYVAVERDTLNLLHHHPGCIKLFATFQDDYSLYYVLEYAANGEILKIIKDYGSLSLDCTTFYAAEILDAIDHMHSRGVIHRDLKPENILLDTQMRIKIADFGSAKILKAEEESSTEPRTAEYVSPELLLHKTTTKNSDIWAYGCILFQMLSGAPPFRTRSEYLTFQKITTLDYEFLPEFPSIARDLIEKLLILEPTQRLSLQEIKSHGIFYGFDWNSIWNGPVPEFQTGIVKPLSKSNHSNLVKIEDFLSLPPLPLSVHPSPDLRGKHFEEGRREEGAEGGDGHEEEEGEVMRGQTESDGEGCSRKGEVKVEKKLDRRKSRLESSLSAKKKAWLGGSGSRKTSGGGESSGSDGGAGVGSTWPEVFLPNELMIYSTSSMKETSKTEETSTETKKISFKRLFKTPNSIRKKKSRMNYTLVLTDFPRLLFVSEDLVEQSVKIEIEILFKELPLLEVQEDDGNQTHQNLAHNDREQNDRNLNQNDRNQNQDKNSLDYFLFKEVDLISCTTFEVRTSNGKTFKFEDPSESAQRWKDEIFFAFESCKKKNQKK